MVPDFHPGMITKATFTHDQAIVAIVIVAYVCGWKYRRSMAGIPGTANYPGVPRPPGIRTEPNGMSVVLAGLTMARA